MLAMRWSDVVECFSTPLLHKRNDLHRNLGWNVDDFCCWPLFVICVANNLQPEIFREVGLGVPNK